MTLKVDWGQVFQQKNLKITNSIINVFISKLRLYENNIIILFDCMFVCLIRRQLKTTTATITRVA